MTESVLSRNHEQKSNRLDPPHESLTTSNDIADSKWLGFAGRDPKLSTQQVDRQASELLSYVQEQNREIDERQAEINAKLAQLDNQIRNTRLRTTESAGDELTPAPHGGLASDSLQPVDSGIDLESYFEKDVDSVKEDVQPSTVKEPTVVVPEEPIDVSKLGYVQEEIDVRIHHFHSAHTDTVTYQEFEEVERLVSKLAAAEEQTAVVSPVQDERKNDEHTNDEPTSGEKTSVVSDDGVEEALDELPSEEETFFDETIGDELVENRFQENPFEDETEDPLADLDSLDSVSLPEDLQAEDGWLLDVDESLMESLVEADRFGVENRIETPKPQQSSRKSIDAFPKMLAKSHLERVDMAPNASVLGDPDALASERRLLADRKLELDRRKAVLGRMHDETQALHREALEMRIVTEQLWAKLSDSTPPEKLTELVGSLRSQLDQHYTREQSTINDRKQELLDVQQLLEEKQAALRDQANQLQTWFASRQEDIKTYASEVQAREMLLDQREHRMQDEFAKWEAKRRAYEGQLKGLMGKLQANGVL